MTVQFTCFIYTLKFLNLCQNQQKFAHFFATKVFLCCKEKLYAITNNMQLICNRPQMQSVKQFCGMKTSDQQLNRTNNPNL